MKIRFYNTYEPASPLYKDLVPYLSEQGIEVDIVISRGEYRPGRDLDAKLANLPGVNIIKTFNLGRHAYQSTLSKFIVTFTYAIHAGFIALFGSGSAVNVYLTQPPFFYAMGYIASFLRRQPYYCVIMDVQPQEAIEFGLLQRNALWTKFLMTLSTISLQKAKGVIVIGRCMADQVAKMGVDRAKIYLAPNWMDERTVHPIANDQNPFRKDHSWDDKFVVMYGGNIGNAQYFDDFIAVAKRLTDHPKLHFAFVGEGSRAEYVKQKVSKYQLTNMTLLPFMHNQYSLSQILSAGDLHFISLKESCTGLGVPSKAYATLAVGRPIVYQGSDQGEIARMIMEEKIGTVVPYKDANGLEMAILKYAKDQELYRTQAQNARVIAETTYGHQNAIKKYADILIDNWLINLMQKSRLSQTTMMKNPSQSRL